MQWLLQKRFQQQVITTLLAQVAVFVFSFATAAIIARQLGPEGKGIVNLSLLLPGMLGLFLSGGIGVGNVYFAGSKRLDVSTLATNSVTFAALATLVGIALVGSLVVTGWLEVLLPGVPVWLVLLAMLGLPFRLLSGYLSNILQGLQRIFSVNVVNSAQGMFTLAFTMLLVVGFRQGIGGAVLASLGAVILGLVVLIAFLRREGCALGLRWDGTVMRSTLTFGLKGHIGNVLQFFNYRLDMFIVNLFLGPASVGIYSVSVALAELLWYLPNAVSFVIFPKAAASTPEALNAFTPRVFRITVGLTALGALGLVLLGKPLIELVYSSAFIDAYVPMLVLLPGVVLLGGGKVLTNEIAGRGYPHYNSVNAGLSFALTVMLDLVLIPRYGVVGASLASSLAYTAVFAAAIGFYLVVSRRTGEASPSQVITL